MGCAPEVIPIISSCGRSTCCDASVNDKCISIFMRYSKVCERQPGLAACDLSDALVFAVDVLAWSVVGRWKGDEGLGSFLRFVPMTMCLLRACGRRL
jgi:hypothetical protein